MSDQNKAFDALLDAYDSLLATCEGWEKMCSDMRAEAEAKEMAYLASMEEAARAVACGSEAIDHLQKVIDGLRAKNNQLLGELVELAVAIDLRDRPSRN